MMQENVVVSLAGIEKRIPMHELEMHLSIGWKMLGANLTTEVKESIIKEKLIKNKKGKTSK